MRLPRYINTSRPIGVNGDDFADLPGEVGDPAAEQVPVGERGALGGAELSARARASPLVQRREHRPVDPAWLRPLHPGQPGPAHPALHPDVEYRLAAGDEMRWGVGVGAYMGCECTSVMRYPSSEPSDTAAKVAGGCPGYDGAWPTSG